MADETLTIIIQGQDYTGAATTSAEANFRGLGLSLQLLGTNITQNVTEPIVDMGKSAISASIEYESAFAGVIKTTDGLGESIHALTPLGQELYNAFQDLSTEIPITATQLANIGEIAGQLGVPAEDILFFTETIAGISVATNMTAEQAANDFARIANIMQMPISEVDRLGATIVDLGNKGASTESEITALSLRIAGMGSVVGLSTAQVAGWGAAISNVGIEAEMGGSAISRVFANMSVAVQKGGDELEGFAKVAGMTVPEFSRLFKEDASAATLAFVKGLGDMNKAGGPVLSTLESLDLDQIRVRDTLLRLASASPVLEKALKDASTAWSENSALVTETGRRYVTSESQIQVTKNTVNLLAISFGNILTPVLVRVGQITQPLITHFTNLDDGTKKIIISVLAAVAVIGPMVLALGTLALAVSVLSSPIGLVVLGVTLLVAGITALIVWLNSGSETATAFGQAISTGLAPMIAFAKGLFADMAEFFSLQMGKIKAWVDANWPLIQQTITIVLGVIRGIFEVTWSVVQTTVEVAWNLIKIVISAALDIILGLVRTVMLLITGDWEGAWNQVLSIFDTIGNLLLDLVIWLWDSVLAYGETTIDSIWTGISTWWNLLDENTREWLATAWENITVWWDNLKTGASEWLGGLTDDLLQGMYNIATGIDTRLTEVWGKVSEWATKIGHDLKQPFIDAKDFISNLHIPMPHVNVGWRDGPLGIRIPTFSVSWYGAGTGPWGQIFNGPTLIGVGERGPERVTITPLSGGAARGGNGATYNITVQAAPSNAVDALHALMRKIQMGTVGA